MYRGELRIIQMRYLEFSMFRRHEAFNKQAIHDEQHFTSSVASRNFYEVNVH